MTLRSIRVAAFAATLLLRCEVWAQNPSKRDHGLEDVGRAEDNLDAAWAAVANQMVILSMWKQRLVRAGHYPIQSWTGGDCFSRFFTIS